MVKRRTPAEARFPLPQPKLEAESRNLEHPAEGSSREGCEALFTQKAHWFKLNPIPPLKQKVETDG